MDQKLRVLLLAAEAVPFTKVGGLAEFASALPKALRRLDVDVRLMMPHYGERGRLRSHQLRHVGGSLPVQVGSQIEPAHLMEGQIDGVPVYLIYNDQFFGNRERVYGFNDDPQRFMFFSRAVIAALNALDWSPDVVHTNDWHTAPVATWLDVYGSRDPAYEDIATLFTIHEFAYQGLTGRLILDFGQMTDVEHLDVEPPGKVNWLAQGIAHADVVNTVSPTYAREILTPDVGGDLQPLLERRRDRLYGILGGIDTDLWNPETDESLAQTFDVNSLNMRSVNKTALQRELRLPSAMDVPLLGLVTRLDPLKGLDLLHEAIEDLLQRWDLQFVLLGTGDEEIGGWYTALQARHSQSVRALIRYDERMARRIYGSTDLFVMPSQQESLSVGLMTAMHYGAVPVVHAIGGLADIVVDADEQPDRGNGFSFTDYDRASLIGALERALQAYGDEAAWVTLQRRAMNRDVSWDASAQAYVDLYNHARWLRRTRSRRV